MHFKTESDRMSTTCQKLQETVVRWAALHEIFLSATLELFPKHPVNVPWALLNME